MYRIYNTIEKSEILDENGIKNNKLFPSVFWNYDTHQGYTEWWYQGKLHNENGPAITNKHGYEAYYINGIRHRIDGPAMIKTDDRGTEYWLYGKQISQEVFEKRTKGLYNKVKHLLGFNL